MAHSSGRLWGHAAVAVASLALVVTAICQWWLLPDLHERQQQGYHQQIGRWQQQLRQRQEQLVKQAHLALQAAEIAPPEGCALADSGQLPVALQSWARAPWWPRPSGVVSGDGQALWLVARASRSDGRSMLCWQDWHQWQPLTLARQTYRLDDGSAPRALRDFAGQLINDQQLFGRYGSQPLVLVADLAAEPRLIVELQPPPPTAITDFIAVVTLGVFASLLVLLLSAASYWRWLRPLKRMVLALSHQQRPATSSDQLLQALTEQIGQLLDQRNDRDRQLVDLGERLARLSAVDPLTGVSNRQRYDQFCVESWARCQHHQHPWSLLLLRLADWQQIATRLSPADADQRLRQLAQRLEGNLHRATDLLARIAPDCFAVVLPETPTEGLQRVAAKLQVLCQGDAGPGQALVIACWSGVPQADLSPAVLTSQLLTELAQSNSG